jgi:hypothetical protein
VSKAWLRRRASAIRQFAASRLLGVLAFGLHPGQASSRMKSSRSLFTIKTIRFILMPDLRGVRITRLKWVPWQEPPRR